MKCFTIVVICLLFFSCHQKKDSFYDINRLNADKIDLIETVEDVYNHLEAVEKSAIMLMNTKWIKDSVLFYSGKLQGIQDAKKILLEFKMRLSIQFIKQNK